MSLSLVPWQVLIVVSSLLTTIGLNLNKYQSHKGSALQTQASKYLGSFTWVLMWWLIISRSISGNWWIYYLYGMAVATSVVIYTKAQRINMSLTSMVEPVGHLTGIIAVVVLLSEWKLFVGHNGYGLIVALALIPVMFWLFIEPKSEKSKTWLKLVIFYLLSLTVFKVLVKIFLYQANAVEILVFQYLGSLTAATLGVLIKKQRASLRFKFVVRGVLQGWIASSGIILLYTAIKYSSVSQTTLLKLPLILVLKIVSGMLIFKEIQKMSLKKWLGTILAGVIALLVIITSYQPGN